MQKPHLGGGLVRMVLVDSSIWIDHLRKPLPPLIELLEEQAVVTHPFIRGELACGYIQNREDFLHCLQGMPQVPCASDSEVMAFIELCDLAGQVVGYLDMHLLASAKLAGNVRLWTGDKKLAALAAEMSVAH